MLVGNEKMFREKKQKHDTLTITNQSVAQWFMGLMPEQQDHWIQDVTGESSAMVEGYMLSTDPTLLLEIDVTFLG